jgi:hypothetical protein
MPRFLRAEARWSGRACATDGGTVVCAASTCPPSQRSLTRSWGRAAWYGLTRQTAIFRPARVLLEIATEPFRPRQRGLEACAPAARCAVLLP